MSLSKFFLSNRIEIEPILPKNTKNQLNLKNSREKYQNQPVLPIWIKTSLDGDISQN